LQKNLFQPKQKVEETLKTQMGITYFTLFHSLFSLRETNE
jgi:hypothetical protein